MASVGSRLRLDGPGFHCVSIAVEDHIVAPKRGVLAAMLETLPEILLFWRPVIQTTVS